MLQMVALSLGLLMVFSTVVHPSYLDNLGQHLVNGNSQYVDYGLHLDKCSEVITFALWLNVHAYKSIILNTGGMTSSSIGYWLVITGERSIKISVKNESMYHQYEAPEFPLNEWFYIVFTWAPSNTGLVHLYINGCGVDATNEKGRAFNLAHVRRDLIRS